jgi:SAM-dependent methyltransferase
MRTAVDHEGRRTIQQIWDHHCSYQWTYFDELIKQTIDFFLAQRLEGKNVDIGGGWYLPYPNSDVVDVSPVGLKYNLAPKERKHQFDLDTIAEGAKLPFEGHSFDSATLISVWQYVKEPFKMMAELERVLRPGGEVYIINGQGAGLDECKVNSSHTNAIIQSLREKGYRTWWEQIPTLGGSEAFQSVCVTLPGGAIKKRTLDKERFLDQFLEHEARICRDKALQIAEYPITKLAGELRRRANAFSKEYAAATGATPYVFSEYELPPALSMLFRVKPTFLHPDSPLSTLAILNEPQGLDAWDMRSALMKKHGFSASVHANYFSSSGIQAPQDIERALKGMLRPGSLSSEEDCTSKMREKLLRFAVTVPVNENAELLHADIRRAAGQGWGGAAKQLREYGGAMLYQQCMQHKQRRGIDGLIARKEEILAEPKNIVGWGRFDVPIDMLYEIKKAIRKMGGHYSQPGFSDD